MEMIKEILNTILEDKELYMTLTTGIAFLVMVSGAYFVREHAGLRNLIVIASGAYVLRNIEYSQKADMIFQDSKLLEGIMVIGLLVLSLVATVPCLWGLRKIIKSFDNY